MLIITVLFITLANLKQLSYQITLLLKIVDLYKKYWLKFQSIKGSFFYFFGFNVYILVDSMDIYKYLNISV